MSGDDRGPPEEQLADALAAYDDLLASGWETHPEELQKGIDPELLPHWNRVTAFLSLVEQAWPRRRDQADRLQEAGPGAIVERGDRGNADSPVTRAIGVRRFGRFEIVRSLGHGGFGVVMLAWDPVLARAVALKVPQPEALVTPEAQKRFEREARAAAKLDHPNIVPVYESGRVGTIAYIAAAYCPGPTLAEWLARQVQPVPVRDAAELTATLARALQHAHARGVLHRDLKPSNILLEVAQKNGADPAEDGSPSLFQPRITDFGLARLADGLGPETRSGVPFGSLPYMAPEQAEGRLKEIGPSTDVYGLGSVLFELLTGKPPFRGEGQIDTLRRLIAEDAQPPRRARPDIPAELEAIVLKCLEKRPARRYPAAHELAEDLERFLAGEPTRARPESAIARTARALRRHRVASLALLTALVLVAVALAGVRWYERRLERVQRIVRQRDLAILSQAEAGHRLRYVADIRQVDRLIRDAEGLLAQEILMRYRPRPGEEDLREFAWFLLWHRCHTERATLTGHGDEVYHVEFSPRGDLLASAGKDGMVLIWETRTWKLVREIGASRTEVNIATFSPDGHTLATVDDDGELKLWEIATGRLELERLAHKGDAVIAQFTPDGKTIITGGRKDGCAKLWDRKTGAVRAAFRSPDHGLEGAVLSKDGLNLVTVGGSEVAVWDLPRWVRVGSHSASHGDLQAVALSRDGTKLATADEMSRLLLWDWPSRQALRWVDGHYHGVFALAFSADNRTVLSGSDDCTIRFWDVATGAGRGVHLGHKGRVWCLALSPDGRTVASAGRDRTVKLWDPEPPRFPLSLAIPHVTSIEFSADGRSVSALEPDGNSLRVTRCDIQSGMVLDRTLLALGGPLESCAFSSDARLLAVRTRARGLTLWNAGTGLFERVLDPRPESLQSFQFSPDARYLLEQHGQARLCYRDLITGDVTFLPERYVNHALWMPAGDFIAERSDGTFIRWDPGSGRSTSLVVKQGPDTRFIAISRAGMLASHHRDERTRLWSSETLELKGELRERVMGLTALALSPDGKTLACAGSDRTVKLWNVVDGEELLTLETFPGPTAQLRFSPDGKVLAALCSSGPGYAGP
jgi:WD40 repeat protein